MCAMSDLFMKMQRGRRHHHQHQNHIADNFSNSNSSFNSSACNEDEQQQQSTTADANEVEDEISNILSLKLKKPKHWKWELTTSRSCANIALPRILLYDHKGQLLVDANSQDEQIYKPTVDNNTTTTKPNRSRKRSTQHAATANLAHSIRQVLQQEFNGLQIQEATPSLQSPTTSTQQTRNSSPFNAATSQCSSCIDFYTNDLPDYKFERRSSSLKGVRFKDAAGAVAADDTKSSINSFELNGLPTPPPSSGTTPTTTTTTTGTGTGSSSTGGPTREKRRYRRSQSSAGRSPSILERFSYNKGRFSSPEFAEEQEVYRAPRYFLRTSKAGTLVVQEESFSRCRRRPPRPKNSSSENLPNSNSPRSHSTSSLKMPQSAVAQFLAVQANPSSIQTGSLQNVAELQRKKKTLPIRRFRSDGNVLLQAIDTSSDEAENFSDEKNVVDESCLRKQRPRHKYENLKRHLKGDLVSIHPENGVYHPYGSPTER